MPLTCAVWDIVPDYSSGSLTKCSACRRVREATGVGGWRGYRCNPGKFSDWNRSVTSRKELVKINLITLLLHHGLLLRSVQYYFVCFSMVPWKQMGTARPEAAARKVTAEAEGGKGNPHLGLDREAHRPACPPLNLFHLQLDHDCLLSIGP